MRLTETLTENTFNSWLQSMRLPFHSVGLIPFILGVVLALNNGYLVSWPLVFSALLAVFFIMLATYLLGEYYDFRTDRLNKDYNRFSGGGRAFLQKEKPPKSLLVVAFTAIILAAATGLLLHFYFRTGPLTIPLGATGIFCGVFYSGKPFQWAYRGLGEVMVAFCYGWLTINTGYYLMAGTFHFTVSLFSIPVALSIFNVILINQFPDYNADKEAGKNNLVVRYGKEKMAVLYNYAAVTSIIIIPAILFWNGFPTMTISLSLPLLLLGCGNILALKKKAYNSPSKLENICGTTILFNLMTSIFFIMSLLIL